MDIHSAKLTASQLWISYNLIRSSIYTAYKLYLRIWMCSRIHACTRFTLFACSKVQYELLAGTTNVLIIINLSIRTFEVIVSPDRHPGLVERAVSSSSNCFRFLDFFLHLWPSHIMHLGFWRKTPLVDWTHRSLLLQEIDSESSRHCQIHWRSLIIIARCKTLRDSIITTST